MNVFIRVGDQFINLASIAVVDFSQEDGELRAHLESVSGTRSSFSGSVAQALRERLVEEGEMLAPLDSPPGQQDLNTSPT